MTNRDSGQSSDEAYDNTRRRFLAGSAGALGGLAMGSLASGSALADEGDDDNDEEKDGNGDHSGDDGDEPTTENPSEGAFEDDVDILNYALTLEHLEAEFYIQSLDYLSDETIRGSETLEPFGDEITHRVIDDLEAVREHEEIHAEVLEATIEDLGGDPIDKPEFDFGGATEDPDEFLATAQVLENTGVTAYNGAIGSVEDSGLTTAGATIATVEARHASFLNVLNGEIGFPRAFDEARSPDEIREIAADFITSDMDGMMGGHGDDSDDNGDNDDS